jgi:integrase
MSIHLHTAAQRYIDDLKARGLSDHHTRTVFSKLKKVVKEFPSSPIDRIKLPELEQFVYRSYTSPVSRRNLIRALRGLFSWAQDHEHLPQEMRHVAARVKTPKVIMGEPEVYTVDEMRRMLQAACGLPEKFHWVLHYLVLGGFSGLRTSEIHRLEWKDVLPEHGCVRMSRAITKTGTRRMAQIPPNAVEWLNLTPGQTGKVIPAKICYQNIQREVDRACRVAEVAWKKNALRHSYVTYAMAIARNAWEVAEQVGNSPKVLQAHYKGLVLPSEAEDWFSITPSNTL